MFIAILAGAVILGGIAGAIWAWHHYDPNKAKEQSQQQPQKQPQPPPPITRLNSSVVLAVALVALLFQLPSISIDIALIFSYAADIVTLMMPLIGVGAGISFGFALVAYIIRLFRQVF